VSVDKTVIEARDVFIGDGKAATKYEALKEGIHWASPTGERGFIVDGVIEEHPGSSTTVTGRDIFTLAELKPGSLYLTTPSINYEFRDPLKKKLQEADAPKDEKPVDPNGDGAYAKVELKGRLFAAAPGAFSATNAMLVVRDDEYALDLSQKKELQAELEGEGLRKLEGRTVVVTGTLSLPHQKMARVLVSSFRVVGER
jgi:hypothetical protein